MDNKSFSCLRTILLTCWAVCLFAIIIIIISPLIIKFYLDIDNDVKTWLYIEFVFGGSIEILILLFGIFVVNRQHYECTIGFTTIQILNLILAFSYLIYYPDSQSTYSLLTLIFIMEFIIVTLCILYAFQLENDNKLFLCIKSILLSLIYILVCSIQSVIF